MLDDYLILFNGPVLSIYYMCSHLFKVIMHMYMNEVKKNMILIF